MMGDSGRKVGVHIRGCIGGVLVLGNSNIQRERWTDGLNGQATR